MKLRNKITGEIIDIYKGEITLHHNQGRETIHFKCLEDLEEWEDYEEPKEDGLDNIITLVEAYSDHDSERYPKEIVEKLKTWKRLKDKGFRFLSNKTIGEYGSISYCLTYPATRCEDKDLYLLFGGEEWKI